MSFFSDIPKYFTDNMVILGDFNSVESPSDHASGNLDPTSSFLHSLITVWNLKELKGSHLKTFTYHHPSVSTRKSRIDHIYGNGSWMGHLGFSYHISVSDHYLVGTHLLPTKDVGPKMWHFPVDLLSNSQFVEVINPTS